jgi:hypothetical protein
MTKNLTGRIAADVPLIITASAARAEAVEAGAGPALEAFAADLTAAAYLVALRHGLGDRWLDLELDLWRALTETVKKWGREGPRAAGPWGRPSALVTTREGP